MNIGEQLTRDMTVAGVSVVLRDGAKDATVAVKVDGWLFRDGTARGSAVFGPYPESVSASGVRAIYKDGVDDVSFGSVLNLPAGQTYRYTLTVGVS